MTSLEAVRRADLAAVCRRNRIREPSVFGSVARGEDQPDSDIDLLVELDGNAVIGCMAIARASSELCDALGREVDLVPKDGLKELIRDDALAKAQVLDAIDRAGAPPA